MDNTTALNFFLQISSSGSTGLIMGTGASRREPEVHVVVVQSQENGKMEAKVLRRSYTTSIRRERERERKDSQEGQFTCDVC